MVIIYTKPGCPYTRGLTRKLRHERIPYQEIDVIADHEMYKEMLALNGGHSATPTWVYNGKVYVGFHGSCPIDEEDLCGASKQV